MTEEIDADKIFEYKLFNSWRFPIVSISVYDCVKDNVKCLVWYATHAPDDLALTQKYSLNETAIDRIKSIISNNQGVFEIEEIEFPFVLDGFSNEFFFKDEDKSISLDASNISAWQECEETIEDEEPVNAKLILKVFSDICEVCAANGVDSRYFSLVWE